MKYYMTPETNRPSLQVINTSVELRGGKRFLKVEMGDGERFELPLLKSKKKVNEDTLKYLTVASLILPMTFPESYQNVEAEFGYQVEEQGDIKYLSNKGEAFYQQALGWACPNLQRLGYGPEDVARYLAEINPRNIVARSLGTVSNDVLELQIMKIAVKLAEYFPSGISAKKRRKHPSEW